MWVDARTVASRIGVSYATVMRWAKIGLIPSVKVGHVRRFRIEKVVECIEAEDFQSRYETLRHGGKEDE